MKIKQKGKESKLFCLSHKKKYLKSKETKFKENLVFDVIAFFFSYVKKKN